MYDILVYLFENYYTPQACPRAEILASKLAAAGFEHDDIDDALSWLRELAQTTEQYLDLALPTGRASHAPRIYTEQEYGALGTEAIGFIVFLENSGALSPALREILIGCAQAADGAPLSLSEIKVLALMVLWSQEAEVDHLIFEELLADDTQRRAH
ncbi:Protein Smg OS=Castellaniella defragrans OX=75697 GN=smg PE=3 SV=1 [Castellaniella defragrans]